MCELQTIHNNFFFNIVGKMTEFKNIIVFIMLLCIIKYKSFFEALTEKNITMNVLTYIYVYIT